MDNDFFEQLSEMTGERVRIQTPDSVYRGVCKSIDSETLSLLLRDVEELSLFGRPTEREEEEWHWLCEEMIIHGDYVETVSVEAA